MEIQRFDREVLRYVHGLARANTKWYREWVKNKLEGDKWWSIWNELDEVKNEGRESVSQTTYDVLAFFQYFDRRM